MCDKMAISAHILKIVENDPGFKGQLRKCLIVTNFFIQISNKKIRLN